MKKSIRRVLILLFSFALIFNICLIGACSNSDNNNSGNSYNDNSGNNNSGNSHNDNSDNDSSDNSSQLKIINISMKNIKQYYSFDSILEKATIDKASYQIKGSRISSLFTGSVEVKFKVELTFIYKMNLQYSTTTQKKVTDNVTLNSSLGYLSSRKTVYSYLTNRNYLVDVTMSTQIVSASGKLTYIG